MAEVPRTASARRRPASSCVWCGGADAEFDWWPTVLRRLLAPAPLHVRLAAACRGTGDRPVLEQVAAALAGTAAGGLVVDVGAGAGGPAEWLRRTGRRRVLAVDESASSCRTARRLFPALGVARGTATALPVGDAAADGLLLAGVLSLGADPAPALAEASRAARPGAALVVTDYTAVGDADPDLPPGTRCHPRATLLAALDRTGWDVDVVRSGPAPADLAWVAARRRVRAAVRQHVRGTPHGLAGACPAALAAEERATTQFGRAIRDGALERVLLTARSRGAGHVRRARDRDSSPGGRPRSLRTVTV